MEAEHVTTVRIHGREYRIRGAADEEYIRTVAEFVDRRMKEVAASTSSASSERVAVLAALNIADELFELRRQRDSHLADIEQRADRLIRMIDSTVPGDD